MNDPVLLTRPDSVVALPSTYLAARIALAKCDRIDECQEWQNKAAAMASYARQAQDDALEVMSARIRARAARRCGELLKEIPPHPGGHVGDARPTRRAAAEDAGLSRVQRNRAIALANIPEKKFEQLVERKKPATIHQLATIGTRRRGVTANHSSRVHQNCPSCTCCEEES